MSCPTNYFDAPPGTKVLDNFIMFPEVTTQSDIQSANVSITEEEKRKRDAEKAMSTKVEGYDSKNRICLGPTNSSFKFVKNISDSKYEIDTKKPITCPFGVPLKSKGASNNYYCVLNIDKL